MDLPSGTWSIVQCHRATENHPALEWTWWCLLWKWCFHLNTAHQNGLRLWTSLCSKYFSACTVHSCLFFQSKLFQHVPTLSVAFLRYIAVKPQMEDACGSGLHGMWMYLVLKLDVCQGICARAFGTYLTETLSYTMLDLLARHVPDFNVGLDQRGWTVAVLTKPIKTWYVVQWKENQYQMCRIDTVHYQEVSNAKGWMVRRLPILSRNKEDATRPPDGTGFQPQPPSQWGRYSSWRTTI